MRRWFVAASAAVVLSVVVLGTLAQSALRAQGNRDDGLAARVEALEAREAADRLLSAQQFEQGGKILDRD